MSISKLVYSNMFVNVDADVDVDVYVDLDLNLDVPVDVDDDMDINMDMDRHVSMEFIKIHNARPSSIRLTRYRNEKN